MIILQEPSDMVSQEQQENVFREDAASGGSVVVGGIENFSIVDFPGKMASVLFLQGCPWRCPFCYNVHLQPFGGKSAYTWKDVKNFLLGRKKVLDAVVFTGGEPLAQKAVKQEIKEVKDMGYQIGIHTGGYYPDLLAEIIPDIDWVGLDIKAPFDRERYKTAVGGIDSLDRVSRSLGILTGSGIAFEARTTCDPRILTIADIYAIAETLKLKGVKNYHLQRYRQVPGDETPDSACDAFFQDKELERFLRNNFEHAELRS